MIKALIFDCFGVLYWDNINRLYNLAPLDQLESMVDLVHAFDHGYLTKDDFLSQVADLSGVEPILVNDVMIKKHSRNDELIDRVKELKSHYKVGMLTNMGADTLYQVFSKAEREQLFDDVLVSSDVGLIKPSLDIFELAIERLGVQPEEIIFIDDRPANTEGAERAGMKTILFTGNKQFEIEFARLTDSVNA